MSSPAPQEEVQACPSTEDPRWLLVERILQTEDFLRAPRLAEFLLYICRASLEGRSSELNEQHIGKAVFGRSPEYDSGADTVVRSNALRLRRRLEEYFLHEGCKESLRLEIPRGAYVPRFYPRERKAPFISDVHVPTEKPADFPVLEVCTSLPSSPEPSSQGKWFRRKWFKLFLAGLSLAAVVMIIAHRIRHDAAVASGHSEIKQTEIERRFWNSMFPPDGKTIVVPGDSGLVLYETFTGRELTLADYLGGAYRNPNRTGTVPSTASQTLAADVAYRRYTSIVDLGISSQLSHLPQWSSERATTVFARDLTPSEADNSNLILLGTKEANPWVSLVEPSMNFVLVPDKKPGFCFLNRHPRNGELAEYATHEASGGIGAPVVYGDVAYLPNPSGKGMVLVLSGLWMSGTQSAGNFVLGGTRFSDWLKSIANPDGAIPPFELLIATKSLENSATYSSIIAKRVYSR